MSDPGREKREWRFYLEDMFEFTLKVPDVYNWSGSGWLHR